MASTALAKLKEKHADSLSRARRRAQDAVAARQHTVVAVGSAFAVGWAEKSGLTIPTIPGFDPSTTIGLLAYVGAESRIGGAKMSKTLQSIADGQLSITAYKLGADLGGGSDLGL